jgi:myo-inositol 2-dehydrogenase/D-chiro-inositol 1-dehydrogenase
MKQLALIGAGRIGKVHALAIESIRDVKISHVCDVHQPSAEALAKQCDATVTDLDTVFSDKNVDAVIIASATDTHTPMLKRCAEAGKPVFCEKPLDLSLATAREAASVIEASGILCGMGFNRRFDPQFSKLKQRVAAGDVGTLETLIVISRDPSPPPIDYINVSGGLFRDMMIHDFDIARWILDEPIESLYATGSCLVDNAIADAGDIDTASVTMRTASGKIAIITNSRRAVYGYDQRIEAFGSNGMLQAMNNSETNLVHSGEQGVTSEVPLHFFLERYEAAYRNELIDFVDALQNNTAPLANHLDGVASLQLAEAANASLASGASVDVSQF